VPTGTHGAVCAADYRHTPNTQRCAYRHTLKNTARCVPTGTHITQRVMCVYRHTPNTQRCAYRHTLKNTAMCAPTDTHITQRVVCAYRHTRRGVCCRLQTHSAVCAYRHTLNNAVSET
jgi:hypothetical protein